LKLNLKGVVVCGFLLAGILLGLFEMRRLRRIRDERLELSPASDAPDYGCASELSFPVPESAADRINDITDLSGVQFEHSVGPLGSYFMPESTGAGVAVFDFDGDGRQDLYFVNSGQSPRTDITRSPGVDAVNRLYRQLEDGTFTDVTETAGIGDRGYGGGVAVGDVNQDGFPDVFVTNYGQDALYLNNGNSTFREVAQSAGIHENEWGTCAAFLDYDRDGWLDLMVVNYTADPQYGHSVACGFLHGMVSYCGPHKFEPTIDRLYRNVTADEATDASEVRFRDVTSEVGLDTFATYGFGVVPADFTGDGWCDIFVANDGAANCLWVNQKDGTFAEEAAARGLAVNRYGHAEAGMGVAMGDVNGDQRQDLVVSHLSRETTTVYAGTEAGLYRDITEESELGRASMEHTGWGIALRDLNHDGYLDLAQVNGLVIPCHSGFAFHGEDQFQVRTETIKDAAGYWEAYADVNFLLLGGPDGAFTEQPVRGGDFCSRVASGRGLATSDLDNDGDVDLIVTNCGTTARIFRNDLDKLGNWLQLRVLTGDPPRDAVGAAVTVKSPSREWSLLVQPHSSYLCSNDMRLHIGLGDVNEIEEIIVHWPDGPVESSAERFAGQAVNQQITIRRGEGISLTKESP
jgi:uncharacterized protein YuzB (UPF0349 family)